MGFLYWVSVANQLKRTTHQSSENKVMGQIPKWADSLRQAYDYRVISSTEFFRDYVKIPSSEYILALAMRWQD